jgi:hypothetical protein
MSLSTAFSTLTKVRSIVAIVSIVAGAGYKFAPGVWHQAAAKLGVKTETKAIAASTVTTNADGVKISSRDLGAIALTNHYETCVQLGAGKDCLLTPRMIDSHNVQLTLAVETKNAKGKIRDLSITQVVTQSGKSFEVAVGEFDFSLTPNVTSE